MVLYSHSDVEDYGTWLLDLPLNGGLETKSVLVVCATEYGTV